MKYLLFLALIFAGPLSAEERQPNHLLGQTSPYLRQHLYNAVDWFPWGEAAFAKARAEGKPIFLSIGYASCHWCRVMAEESFEDETVAGYLNANFIAIKLDREERPDLDEQFMLVTELASGGGGWPNSVFLTPSGAPFYGGGYYPKAPFLDVLHEINRLWQEDRREVERSAAALGDTVRGYLARAARARVLTPELAKAVALRLLGQMDDFNGGFGVAPKFPQESRLLFLLDQAEKTGDSALLDAVQTAANGMVHGGIHDQAGGGFHRYAVDNAWAVPHFEKMLYNQALIGQVLTRLHILRPNPAFARAAQRTFDYVLRDMQAPTGGFYSGQDADSLNADGVYQEGYFYLWTPQSLRAAAGPDADFLLQALNVAPDGPVDGQIPLQLTFAPVDMARLDAGLERLRLSRRARALPHIDQKVLLGWNGEMIRALVAGAEAFGRPDYLAAAEAAARFAMQHMRKGEGYARSYIDRAASIPAQLPDYAGFGLALVALHDADPSGEWLPEAERIARILLARFKDESGVFRMNEQPAGLGAFLPFDDGEVPSGNAQAQRLLTALARRSLDSTFSREAAALAGPLAGHALALPEQRSAAIAAIDAQVRGDTGPLRAVANGAVQVRARRSETSPEVLFTLTMAKGWHINAHIPLDPYFIPTDLSVNGTPLGPEAYPKPIRTTLGFNAQAPLALYEGEVQVRAPLQPGRSEISLSLQSCNNEVCLEPETLHFVFWSGQAG